MSQYVTFYHLSYELGSELPCFIWYLLFFHTSEYDFYWHWAIFEEFSSQTIFLKDFIDLEFANYRVLRDCFVLSWWFAIYHMAPNTFQSCISGMFDESSCLNLDSKKLSPSERQGFHRSSWFLITDHTSDEIDGMNDVYSSSYLHKGILFK